MDHTILTAVSEAFQALDLTEENERLDHLYEEINKAATASETARERCMEIELARREAREPDAYAVADALLAEKTAMDAASLSPSREAMEHERATLQAGMRALRHRVEDAQSDIRGIEGVAATKVIEIAQPLADSIMAEVREHAEALLHCLAEMAALAQATRGFSNETAQIRDAVHGFIGQYRPLGWRSAVEVPAELQQVLAHLTGKGRAHQAGVLTTVRL